MKKPRFTDMQRYSVPYSPSDSTDITRTWTRAREQLEKDRQEREAKVRGIKQLGASRK